MWRVSIRKPMSRRLEINVSKIKISIEFDLVMWFIKQFDEVGWEPRVQSWVLNWSLITSADRAGQSIPQLINTNWPGSYHWPDPLYSSQLIHPMILTNAKFHFKPVNTVTRTRFIGQRIVVLLPPRTTISLFVAPASRCNALLLQPVHHGCPGSAVSQPPRLSFVWK